MRVNTLKANHVMLGAWLAMCFLCGSADAHVRSCNELIGMKLDGRGVVDSANRFAAGETLDPRGKAPVAVCQVSVTFRPVVGSLIRAEFWLPESEVWNGKFLGLGNSGFGGALSGPPGGSLAQGYAAGANDTGHVGVASEAQWAFKQPDRIRDWAYRADHLTAAAGRQLVRAFYGSAAKHSYFHGCSDGGREALMEAERFPADYDGIVAGAPAIAVTGVAAQFAFDARAVASAKLTSAQVKWVTDAMLAQCDALDGVKDGVVENPRACRFDPADLRCKSGSDKADCLTQPQVEAVRAIVQGPRTEQGVQISNGFPIAGLSPEWDTWIKGPNGLQDKMSTEFYRWMVFHDGSWSLDRFNLDHDWKVGKARLAAQINADNPDLRAFVRRGGKLILYQGWADAAMSPENTINFYEAVRKRLGPAAADHARLFMAPGMNHCIRGDGPNVFDAVSTLDKWVEGGPAPEQIIATKYENDLAVLLGSTSKVKRTRPLCAWPTLAQWDGRGSSDDAASFTCVQPK